MPTYRPGQGDDPGRAVRLDHGTLEYRYGPGRTVEIVNIEVDGQHRREGIGRKLVEGLIAEVKGKADMVYAVTRATNEVAHAFYESLQFRVVGVLRRFYAAEDKRIDAVMFGRSVRGPI